MDWWGFYEAQSRDIIPFLRRNLKQVENKLDMQASLAINGLKVLGSEEGDQATLIEDIPWEEIAQAPLQNQNLANTELEEPEEPPTLLLSTSLTPSPDAHGPEYNGYAQLKLRQEYNQLISWSTKEMKFAVNGSQIYPLAPIQLVSLEGTVTLEIHIPDLSIAFEAPLTESACTNKEYRVMAQCTSEFVSPKPKVKYFLDGKCVATVAGYVCPLTGIECKNMQDLLLHHSNYHLNLFFSIHPGEKDAILVEELGGYEADSKEFRYYRTSPDYESLFIASIGLVSNLET